MGFVDYDIVRQRTSTAFNELGVLFGEKNLRTRTTAMLAMRENMQSNAEVGVASVVRNYLQERTVAGTFSGIVSDVVISQIVLPVAQSQSAASRSYARAELFRTLFALEAYQRVHGEYPSSLYQLTPSFSDSACHRSLQRRRILLQPNGRWISHLQFWRELS